MESTNLESRIRLLKNELFSMNKLAITMLNRILEMISNGNMAIINEIINMENDMNQLQLDLDTECYKLMEIGKLRGFNFRLVITILHNTNNMERIGDQITNIYGFLENFLKLDSIDKLKDVLELGKIIQNSLEKVLSIFMEMRNKLELKTVFSVEEKVDDLAFKMIDSVLNNSNMLKENSRIWKILIIRSLERIGDQVTNIAENINFIYTGIDIRHGNFQKIK